MYESFSVFCPCDQLDNLCLLKEEDVLIDWTKPLYLNFTHALIMEKIEEFYSEIGTLEKLTGEVFFQSEPVEEECTEMKLADDAEMLQLSLEQLSTIYELYPANHMECVEVFEKLLDKLPCYGIFSQKGELAAWMVQSYYGAMFSMQTKPDYRRKGYGLILAKYLTKIVKDRGYLPFVVIRPENDASKGLYTKLGFKKHFQTIRAILHPNDMANDQQGGGEVS
ncbi:hypothetical protein WA026_018757 [Henosepilachna vigintioctopunctata]|uniref:N-acetyltransferase domain-containing protein n=1 Tax=Henosepilachna vigintioctopunctata TaxID=420089 RepID=A0AAW1TZT9_9CUCU